MSICLNQSTRLKIGTDGDEIIVLHWYRIKIPFSFGIFALWAIEGVDVLGGQHPRHHISGSHLSNCRSQLWSCDLIFQRQPYGAAWA